PVSYWDIENEPGNSFTYDYSDWKSETVNNIEQEFLVAYRGIKAAVVPPGSAAPKIVCPSIFAFYTYPGQNWGAPAVPDIPSFLNFLDANNIRCDAIAWHENDSSQPVTDTNNQ